MVCVNEEQAAGPQQHVLDALFVEYGALRQELSDRLGNRQRTVTVLGAAAALLAGLGGRDDDAPPGLVLAITIILVIVAAAAWAHNGRMIGQLSMQLAQLEVDIDDAIRGEFIGAQTMTWNTRRQGRTGLARLVFGKGREPIPHRTDLGKGSKPRLP